MNTRKIILVAVIIIAVAIGIGIAGFVKVHGQTEPQGDKFMLAENASVANFFHML